MLQRFTVQPEEFLGYLSQAARHGLFVPSSTTIPVVDVQAGCSTGLCSRLNPAVLADGYEINTFRSERKIDRLRNVSEDLPAV
jgi:hypothetical protein